VGEVSEQIVHRFEVCAVDDRAAFAARGNQAGEAELIQMEGEGGRRLAEALAEFAGGQSGRAFLHQQAENIEPRILRQRAERGDHT
jgi:hypothetical protein